MAGLSVMQRVLKDGTRVVLSKRGGNTIIQRYSQNGALWKTKVKNIAQNTVGNKKVFTKNELFYESDQWSALNVARVTTDRVYNAEGELLGIRKFVRNNEDTCEKNLIKILDAIKNNRTGEKYFLSPEGGVFKTVCFENGIRTNVTYSPVSINGNYFGGTLVHADAKGVIPPQLSGMDVLF